VSACGGSLKNLKDLKVVTHTGGCRQMGWRWWRPWPHVRHPLARLPPRYAELHISHSVSPRDPRRVTVRGVCWCERLPGSPPVQMCQTHTTRELDVRGSGMRDTCVYRLSGGGVISDPPRIIGSYVCPTLGSCWLLATYWITDRKQPGLPCVKRAGCWWRTSYRRAYVGAYDLLGVEYDPLAT
jgi:hypothetical protein